MQLFILLGALVVYYAVLAFLLRAGGMIHDKEKELFDADRD